MRWAALSTLTVDTATPSGYRYEQLSREDIPETVQSIREWHPDVSVGSASGFHHQSFYEHHACLAGEAERDLIVYVCKCANKVVALMSIERHVESALIHSRLAAVSPAHRHSGLANFGAFIMDQQARAMGIAMAYNHVSLKTLYAQKMMERNGFKLVGIVPASDREMITPGIVKHVPEALYVKMYAPAEKLLVPNQASMTPSVREMWCQLFGK
jgi:hypothetical protein